ncbi:MAG: nitroreductase family protein [Candidatus Aureabacteria bacterium]|nr:nitroreductase family protein [Candidatus Auribacterota bacterium]
MRRIPPPPEIDITKCNGCGLCVKHCSAKVLGMRDKIVTVERKDFCFACGHCGAVCPTEAISHPEARVESHLTVGPGPAVNPDAVLKLLRERRSVRFYRPEPLPREMLEKIIEAGRYAPTGSNSQNVHYLVFTDPEEIAKLKEITVSFMEKSFRLIGNKIVAFYAGFIIGRKSVEFMQDYIPAAMSVIESTRKGEDRAFWNAPAVILVHAPAWDSSSAFNCSAAINYCALRAHSLGVGVCFNGFLENSAKHDPKLKKFLGLPKDHRCFGAMTMGYQEVKFRRLVERRQPSVEWR